MKFRVGLLLNLKGKLCWTPPLALDAAAEQEIEQAMYALSRTLLGNDVNVNVIHGIRYEKDAPADQLPQITDEQVIGLLSVKTQEKGD